MIRSARGTESRGTVTPTSANRFSLSGQADLRTHHPGLSLTGSEKSEDSRFLCILLGVVVPVLLDAVILSARARLLLLGRRRGSM